MDANRSNMDSNVSPLFLAICQSNPNKATFPFTCTTRHGTKLDLRLSGLGDMTMSITPTLSAKLNTSTNTIQYNTIQYNIIKYSTMQYNASFVLVGTSIGQLAPISCVIGAIFNELQHETGTHAYKTRV